MTYDEFSEKLRQIKVNFQKSTGKDLKSISELESFLDRKLASPKPRAARAARSLKGVFG